MHNEAQGATPQREAQPIAEGQSRVPRNQTDMHQAGDDLKQQLASAADDAKEQVGASVESLMEDARGIADDQKAAGAERLSGLARAINLAADELEKDLPQAAGYVREAAAKVDHVSTMVRERSLEDLVHGANDFARTNAMAFFGMSLVAGFAVARFLKSSQSERAGQASTSTGNHPQRSDVRPSLGGAAVASRSGAAPR